MQTKHITIITLISLLMCISLSPVHAATLKQTVMNEESDEDSAPKSEERFEKSPPKSLPDITFYDEVGKPHTLEEFYGKVVLLNLWATWCAPCTKEMPDLSMLQKSFKRKNFKIIAISEDFKGVDAIREFYKTNEITNLGLYADKRNAIFNTLGIVGLPTSIIINSEGKEVARVMGYVDWESDTLRNFIDKLTDGKSYAPEQVTLQPPPAPEVPEKAVTTVVSTPTTPPAAQAVPTNPAPAAQVTPANPASAAKSAKELPPEAITTPPDSSLSVGQPNAVTKIDSSSPQYTERRPVNQPAAKPVIDVNAQPAGQ